jgi:hypothetical protein
MTAFSSSHLHPSGILQHFLSLLLGNLSAAIVRVFHTIHLFAAGQLLHLSCLETNSNQTSTETPLRTWSAFLLLSCLETNSNQTSTQTPLRTLFPRQGQIGSQKVSLTVPRKYSTGITMLNTRSPCVITKATCVDCLHFKMSFYSSDEQKGLPHSGSSFVMRDTCSAQNRRLRYIHCK